MEGTRKLSLSWRCLRSSGGNKKKKKKKSQIIMIKCGKCSKRDLWELGSRGDLICLREENKVTFKLAPGRTVLLADNGVRKCFLS